jgi:hypothetical protein
MSLKNNKKGENEKNNILSKIKKEKILPLREEYELKKLKVMKK